MPELVSIDQVKKWAIIAIASDDLLMETLVLKGGNAIDLLSFRENRKMSRASFDLDFSIEDDFDDLEEVKSRIERTLINTFLEHGLIVFDYQFLQRPKTAKKENDFWGGYSIEFKLIDAGLHSKLGGVLERMRRLAVVTNPNHSSRVEIQISKYEYVGEKVTMQVDGYTIYMYSPQMIVFEKIRAICQQMPQYAEIIPSHSPRPRARDFYDIHLICEQCSIDFNSPAAKGLMQLIFEAKRVPISFLGKIKDNAGIHRSDWQNVLDTLPASEKATAKTFDYYLDFIISL